MKQLLRRTLARLGYRVQGTRYVPRQLLDPRRLRQLEFDDLICRRMFEHGPELSFVQIGAFDGVSKDPLRKYIERCRWRGVLVEPQPRAADQLRTLYRGNDRIAILQAALDRHNGRRMLYVVDASAPAWAGGLASFDRQTIEKHAALIPNLEESIREECVDCIRFDEVLGHIRTDALDLLQIDVEGADAYVLSLFPFERVQPAIVHWEVKHLDKVAREGCMDLLQRFGYRFAISGDENMLAVR